MIAVQAALDIGEADMAYALVVDSIDYSIWVMLLLWAINLAPKFNKWVNTAVAIVLLVLAVALGLHFPVYLSLGVWHVIIFAYILVASVAPVWALLQPRDYLNSYLLIFMIVGAVIGVFVSNPSCNLKAFTSFNVDGQYMFPILFVTIACGAVSGFHSLVSSGTASKQIKNEKNMLPVSFGAM